MARKQAKKTLRDFHITKRINFVIAFNILIYNTNLLAGWQSGYAAACKAVYAGSIPASASTNLEYISNEKMLKSIY